MTAQTSDQTAAIYDELSSAIRLLEIRCRDEATPWMQTYLRNAAQVFGMEVVVAACRYLEKDYDNAGFFPSQVQFAKLLDKLGPSCPTQS